MKKDVLYATVIDTAARGIAFQATFLAYIRENHSEEYACDVMMNLYKNHVEFLKLVPLLLYDKPYTESLAQLLIKKSLEAQNEFDYYLNLRNEVRESDR